MCKKYILEIRRHILAGNCHFSLFDYNCNCNWGTCIAPPTRRPRVHHRVNPYLGARRQNETEMFSDRDETSPSIAAVSAPSVGSLFHVQTSDFNCWWVSLFTIMACKIVWKEHCFQWNWMWPHIDQYIWQELYPDGVPVTPLDWVLSHWADFTVRRFICVYLCVFCVFVPYCIVVVSLWAHWGGSDGIEA